MQAGTNTVKMGSREVMEAPNYMQTDMHMFLCLFFGRELMAFIRLKVPTSYKKLKIGN